MLPRDRCDILLTLIDNVARAVENPASNAMQEAASRTTASNLLRCLHKFASDLLRFFDNGLPQPNGKGLGGYTLKVNNVTSDSVFGLIADQMSFDLDAIVRACTQRSLALDDSNRLAQKLSSLAISDALAYSILRPAIDAGLIDANATVFTYFQKSLRIRIIPYARVAFVGVPFTAIREPSEFVALAHEIGHFVYHSRDLTPERNMLQALSRPPTPTASPYRPWLEEIVADVYGCMIAGPAIAISFQDLSLEASKPGFLIDDGRHPVPLIRPYVYTETLRSLAGKANGMWAHLESVASELESAWNTSMTKIGINAPAADIPIPQPSTAPSGAPSGASGTTATAGTAATVSDRPLAQVRTELRTQHIEPLLTQEFGGVLERLIAPPNATPYRFQELWQSPSDWQSDPPSITSESLNNMFWPAPPALPSVDVPATLLTSKMIGYSTVGTETEESEWIEILEFGGWIDLGPAGGVPHN